MIQGRIKTEKEYRATEVDSSSSVKMFSQDRRKYYKTYIEGVKEPDEDDNNVSSIRGKLVETLLWDKANFDNKFCMSCLSSPPDPNTNMGKFVESLYKQTRESTKEDGSVSRTFEDMAKDAYKDSGYKISFEKVIEKFAGKDPEIYLQELINIRSKGLTVVNIDDITNAERIIEELKTNEFIASIINQITDSRYTVYHSLPIEGFDIDGLPMKSLLDMVIIDNKLKLIKPYDLKITWSVENFKEDYLLYRRGYFQFYTYYYALKDWANKNGYEDYHIDYLRFLVADSINYYNPLVYQVNGIDMGKAYDGFNYKGKEYPGVRDTIRGLKFAKEQNLWRISKDNYENEGVVNLNL